MARFFINIVVAIAVTIAVCAMYLDANATGEWTKETQNKLDTLTRIGINPVFARSLITECKNKAKNPVNCIRVGAFISGAESSGANNCHRYNCVGMNDGAV
jgi:hypothetical protein